MLMDAPDAWEPMAPAADETAPCALVIAAETPLGSVAEARALLISLWPAARSELTEALAAGSLMDASAAEADCKNPDLAAEREATAAVFVAKEANAAVSMPVANAEAAAAETWMKMCQYG